MYLAYDGDKVGRKLENLLIDNDEARIEAYANEVWAALHALEKSLKERGCQIIFASGDSVFAKSNCEFNVDEIGRQYGDITFSLGVGKTPLEAMLALKKSKSKGFGLHVEYHLPEGVQ